MHVEPYPTTGKGCCLCHCPGAWGASHSWVLMVCYTLTFTYRKNLECLPYSGESMVNTLCFKHSCHYMKEALAGGLMCYSSESRSKDFRGELLSPLLRRAAAANPRGIWSSEPQLLSRSRFGSSEVQEHLVLPYAGYQGQDYYLLCHCVWLVGTVPSWRQMLQTYGCLSLPAALTLCSRVSGR